MWNAKRRNRRANRNRRINRNCVMKGSLLMIAVAILAVILFNLPEKQQCLSGNCTNSRQENSVYCTSHQKEFEEYKSKAYNYENCTVTYSTGVSKGDIEKYQHVSYYEYGDK